MNLSILIGIIITLIALEIILRLTFGLHNPLLYIVDPQIGYLLAPNQRVRRLKNRIIINEYSMRSSSLREPKQDLRILLLGDSVLNGSWWTDQQDTISAMIGRNLQFPPFLRGVGGDQPALFSETVVSESNSPPIEILIEILNVSANGWSPRNELAYLQKFGLFQSDILILILNTDDLFGTAPTSIPVGLDRYYPSQKPTLAMVEAMTRLFIPYTPPPEMKKVHDEGGDRVGLNLTALGEIYHLALREQIPLIITLTPLWHEVLNQAKPHETFARQRLVQLIEERNLIYLDFLPIFQNHPNPKTLYRDQIHLTSTGNQLVSTEISKAIVGLTLHD